MSWKHTCLVVAISMIMIAMAQSVGQAQQTAEQVESLVSVELDALRQSWQIDLDAVDRPARELLKELLEPLQLRPNVPEELAHAVDKRVTFSRQNVSRLQAVEELCQLIGVYPQYPTSASEGNLVARVFLSIAKKLAGVKASQGATRRRPVTLHPGRRPRPVAFAGPFLIEVTEVAENPPHATGSLKLVCFAFGVPRAVVTVSRMHMESLQIGNVFDDRRNTLLSESASSLRGHAQPIATAITREQTAQLMNLFKSVRTVDVSGSLSIWVPTEVAALRFDNPAAGDTKRAGEGEATLVKLESSGSNYRGQIDRKNIGSDVHIAAYDKLGKQLKITSRGGFTVEDEGQTTFTVKGKPAAIIARGLAEVEKLDLPFHIHNIELKMFDQQPAQHQALEFSGNSPLSLEVLGVVGNFVKEVRIGVKNNSNKDVLRAKVTLHYLGSDGEELKTHSTALSGMQPSARSTLVTSREELTVEAIPFFMPEDTKSVSATLETVQFSDRSYWTPPIALPKDAAPYIAGTGTLRLPGKGMLKIGYFALSSDGEQLSNGVGTSYSADTSVSFVTSTTFEPRNSTIEKLHFGECRFRHVKLPAGEYLVYLKWDTRYCDWTWLDIDEQQSKHIIELMADPTKVGQLQVDVCGKAPRRVGLVPLNKNGDVPFPAEARLLMSIAHSVGLTAELEDGRASFDGLRPGRYRVVAGDLHRDVVIQMDELARLQFDKSQP